MKKTTAIALALVMCLTFGTAALAEAPEAIQVPEVIETMAEMPAEEIMAEVEETAETESLKDKVEHGWTNLISTIEGGWNTVVSTVENGWNTVTGTLADWTHTVETFVTGRDWNAEVQEAWSTLKDAAAHKGEAALDQVTAAYETVRSWFIQVGDTVDQSVAIAVDSVADAAGVVEAKLSGWYRTLETFFAEHSEQLTEEVRTACDTIRQSITNVGSVAQDKLDSAYQTVHDWIQQQGETEDSVVMEALEGVQTLETH